MNNPFLQFKLNVSMLPKLGKYSVTRFAQQRLNKPGAWLRIANNLHSSGYTNYNMTLMNQDINPDITSPIHTHANTKTHFVNRTKQTVQDCDGGL